MCPLRYLIIIVSVIIAVIVFAKGEPDFLDDHDETDDENQGQGIVHRVRNMVSVGKEQLKCQNNYQQFCYTYIYMFILCAGNVQILYQN